MTGALSAAGVLGLTLEIQPDPRELSAVRRAMGSLAIPASRLDVVRLLVSELVTNSIRHSGVPDGRIRVRARISGAKLRVDVVDGGRGAVPPVAGGIRPAPGASSGWGLYLVDALTERWGHGNGAYWFELDLRPS